MIVKWNISLCIVIVLVIVNTASETIFTVHSDSISDRQHSKRKKKKKKKKKKITVHI